jgi:hypothetical protein
MPAYEDLANKQVELIRKALAGSLFLAPMTSTLPTTLTTGTGADLTALPAGFDDIGWVTKDDGLTWSRSTEVSEVNSWGAFDPTRRDINADMTGLNFTAQETKRLTLEMYNNADLSGVTPTAITGEVAFSNPTRPSTTYYRAYGIFVDGSGADAIYVGRLLPRASVTERGDQTWTDGDDAVGYPMTMSAAVDTAAGYSVRHFFGGPGWRSTLVAMGFPALAP